MNRLHGYSDAATGLRVSVLALDTTNQLATVTFDGYTPYCNSALPAVTLSTTIATVTSATCDASQILAFEVRSTSTLQMVYNEVTVLVRVFVVNTVLRCDVGDCPGGDVEPGVGLWQASDAVVSDVVTA